MKYFKPKCMTRPLTGILYNNRGFLTPCCWADGPLEEDDWKEFYAEELNVSNNNSIEDIITSDTWVNFFHDLSNGKIKRVCSIYCMETDIDAITPDHHIKTIDLNND